MGARSQLSWLRNSHRATEALGDRIAELEQQVAALTKELSMLRDRQLDEFDKVRAAVGGATDDLVARVEALRRQIERS